MQWLRKCVASSNNVPLVKFSINIRFSVTTRFLLSLEEILDTSASWTNPLPFPNSVSDEINMAAHHTCAHTRLGTHTHTHPYPRLPRGSWKHPCGRHSRRPAPQKAQAPGTEEVGPQSVLICTELNTSTDVRLEASNFLILVETWFSNLAELLVDRFQRS